MANFEPVTRIEHLLNEIAENTSGGGGGAGLPAVTADDNGDVLTVVEGEWAKAAPSGGGSDIFVVNFTQDENGVVSADKTVEEITTATAAGKTLVAKVYYYFIDRIVTTVDARADHPDQYYDVEVRFMVLVPADYYDDPPEGDVLHNVYIWYDNGTEEWIIEHTEYLLASYGE